MKVIEMQEKEVDFISVYESIKDEKVYTLTGVELKNLVQEANHQLIDLFPIGLYVKDKEGVVLACNREMRKIAGFENYQDIVGKNSYEFSSEETAQEVRANDLLIMEQDLIVRKEEFIELENGEIKYFESLKKTLKNLKGEVIGIAGLSEDITKSKISDEQRKAAEENREAATLASGAVTHDLKNSLAPICMDAELLYLIIQKIEDSDLSQKLNTFELRNLKRICQTLWDRLQNIILEITKADEYNRDMLLGAENLLEKYMENHHIVKCTREIFNQNERRGIPIYDAVAHNFVFRGSNFFVLKILGNLIGNAVRQIQQKRKGEIFISTEITEKYNILKVKDTAGSVTQNMVERILELYKTRQVQGTGFGLASARLWMERMDGKLEVHLVDQDCIEFRLLFPKI